MKYTFLQKNIQENKKRRKTEAGFTLIETMVAVFILTVTLTAFLSVIANSLFSARYAKNEITANYLIQEAVDAIRNDRDTMAFQHYNGEDWDSFKAKYDSCFDSSFASSKGCYIEPTNPSMLPSICSTDPSENFGFSICPLFNYDQNAEKNDFYTYEGTGVKSNLKRQILMLANANPDELDVKVTVEWQNGSIVRSQSLVFSLLNWRQ